MNADEFRDLKKGARPAASTETLLARADEVIEQNLLVESRMGAVAWAIWQRPVSHPRSSNRTCRSPASGSPTGFTVRHTESKPTARGFGTVSNSPSPLDTAISSGACR